MPRKSFRPEEIIAKLREANGLLGQGKRVAEVVKALGVGEVTCYGWRQEYGRLSVSQARRLFGPGAALVTHDVGALASSPMGRRRPRRPRHGLGRGRPVLERGMQPGRFVVPPPSSESAAGRTPIGALTPRVARRQMGPFFGC
jgi:putative transposase